MPTRSPPSVLRLPAVVAVVLALAGCATWTRHELLTFFVDGVPEPGAPTNATPLVATATNAPAAAAADGELEKAAFVHQPYADKDCTSCHESRFSNKTKSATPALCTSCHEDSAKELKEAKVRHTPFEDGDCLACHDAHVANVKGLLIKPVPQLCTECHEDYNAGKFKHDPVSEGTCFECHTVHVAKEPKLLKKPDPAVCLACHDAKDMAGIAEHRKDPEARCSKCHDPHSAMKEKLLK